MKKRLFFIALILTLCLFTSCNSETTVNPANDSSIGENQPDFTTYSYNSYDELVVALCDKDSEGFKQLQTELDKYEYGMNYKSLVKMFSEKRLSVIVPCIGKKRMDLSSKNEWQRIVLLTKELFDLPWILYYCDYNNQTVVVGITYLDILEDFNVSSDDPYEETVQRIAPGFPLPSSASDCKETYNLIADERITLDNSVSVDAVKYVFANNGRTHYRFVHAGCIVSVWAYDPAFELDNEFFASFSLQPLE